MLYPSGEKIALGDIVSVEMPDGAAKARVVMLGHTREHLDMEAESLEWYSGEGLNSTDIVVEWFEGGILKSGAYMATETSCCIELLARSAP